MKSKDEIITILKKLKPQYKKDGLDIIGIFGSVAREENNNFSDVDIVYNLNYEKFSQNYKDGFSKLLRIEDIKEELQKALQNKIDFIPDTNQKILKDIIYV
jgi:predicted nucleotidyltransferase